MKTINKSLVTLSCYCWISCLLGCSSSPSNPGAIIVGPSLEAAVSIDQNCITTINFEDLQNNVYAYRADAIFTIPSIQAGGHDTIDESTDLGFNLFIDTNDLAREEYIIDGSSSIVGTAYIYFIIGNDEYISSNNNTAKLIVENLRLASDGKVEPLTATFNNVIVVNNKDSGDVRCISAFRITFFG